MENISLFRAGRNGYWTIQYKTHEGIRKQKSTGCKTKTDAIKVLSEFKSFLAEDSSKRKGNTLLSSFVRTFLSFAETNYSKHTTYLYKRTLEAFQRINADRLLSQYTAKHYDLYKVTRLREFVQGKIPKKAPKRCMSPITINIELRCLRAAFNTALRWEMIEKNPFEKMQQIPIPKRTPAFLTADDVIILLNAITKSWLKDVIIFAVNTGMRRGELLSLQWQDINVEQRVALISNRDDFTTKSGEERIVALNDAALEVLCRCFRSPLHEYLFSIEGGHRLLPQFLTHQFKEAARAAGSFKTLAAALTEAGLIGTLKGKNPFTVFAPTDEAFAKIPAADLDKLLKDKEALTKVLLYHVVSGKVMSTDVVKLKSAKTVQGSDVTISVKGNNVMINTAKVVTVDIETSNGVIHVIDSVIMPPAVKKTAPKGDKKY